jgi:uncharacterized protein (DUF2336 family)
MAKQTSSRPAGDPRDQAREVLASAAPERRARAAVEIAAEFVAGALSQTERDVAAKVLEVFAGDVAREVREAIAQQVKNCLFLPRSIARRLAEDVDTVAIPVLRYTTVLTDEDLISIVRGGSEAKQIAIAERDGVSEAVSAALIDTDRKTVVSTVLANASAAVAAADLGRAMDRHGGDAGIQAVLARRPKLPVAVMERLISAASEDLRATLLARNDVPAEIAAKIVELARDGALATQLRAAHGANDMETTVAHLAAEKRLTPMFLLRALCAGDIDLFECAIANLSRMPVASAGDFLYRRGGGGQRQILRMALIPDQLVRGFRAAIKLYDERRKADPVGWRHNFTNQAIDRLVDEYPSLAPGSLESVLSQMAHRILGRPDPYD